MNEQRQEWVVDASVGIQLFIKGPLSNAAQNLFDQMTADPPARIYVPDLFYIEIANVLWKYVRWQGLDTNEAQFYLRQLEQLNLQTSPTASLMVDALVQATVYNISAYDACYFVLAQRLSMPLVTVDTKLAKKISDPQRVQLLTV